MCAVEALYADLEPSAQPMAQVTEAVGALPAAEQDLEPEALHRATAIAEDPTDTGADPARPAKVELPPPPEQPCSEALQANITRILRLQAEKGSTMMEMLVGDKRYRNPLFMEKTVRDMGIYEYGTCLDPAILDPHSLPKEDFLPAIRRQLEVQASSPAFIYHQSAINLLFMGKVPLAFGNV